MRKIVLMSKSIGLILLGLSTNNSFANGWLISSPTLGAMEPASGFQALLSKEHIKVTLYQAYYEMEVIYTLDKRREGETAYNGTMLFPVLCASDNWLTYELYESEISGRVQGKCVLDFSASSGRQQQPVVKKDIEGVGPMLAAVTGLNKAARQYLGNFYRINGNVISLSLHEFPVALAELPGTIHIRYSAPYMNYTSGFSKSSFYEFSSDIVYYDFAPAASWTSAAVEEFEIEVIDRSRAVSVEFGEEFDFKERNGIFSFKAVNTRVESLPPLLISKSNAPQKQFLSHQSSLEGHNWQVEADSALEGYPLTNIRDKNPDTAWCTKNTHPTLTVFLQEPKEYCYLEGLALLNGYTKSAAVFKANRRPKTIDLITAANVYKRNSTPEITSFSTMVKLLDMPLQDGWNPYAGVRYLMPRGDSNILESAVIKIGGEFHRFAPEQSEGIRIELQILESHPGEKYEDLCISELYPVFNC